MPRQQQEPAVFNGTTTSLLFVEADVDVQYQQAYTTTNAAQGIETALWTQRAGLYPSNVIPHYQPQILPSQGWTETNDANSTCRFSNHSFFRHPTFHATATSIAHGSLLPLSPTGTGGAPGSLRNFTGSGLHGKQGPSRSTVVVMTLIWGAALVIL